MILAAFKIGDRVSHVATGEDHQGVVIGYVPHKHYSKLDRVLVRWEWEDPNTIPTKDTHPADCLLLVKKPVPPDYAEYYQAVTEMEG